MSNGNFTVVTTAYEARDDLGEGPVQDARSGVLYWVDINRKLVHVHKPADGSHRTVPTPEPVGCIALTSDPSVVLAALEHTIVKLNIESGAVEGTVATVPEEHGREGMRFNDGKVSPQGVFLVGRMHSKWREGIKGRLYALQPGSSELAEVLPEVGLPNGMAWSADGRTFFFIDSAAETITAYDADEKGVPIPSSSRVVSHAPTKLRNVPDGMDIDAEGRLWVALGESSSIACYDPQSGKELRRVQLPVKRPTSCAFGGPGLDTLYVTTRVETDKDASRHHGALLSVSVPGLKGQAAANIFPLQ